MNVQLLHFVDDNKARLEDAIRERMRAHVADSEMSNDVLRDVVSQAFERFVDLTVTDQTDELEAVQRSILTLAAVQPSRLGGILHLYLVIADVIRASFAQEADVDAALVGRALLTIDPHAGQATRALCDAFHAEFSRPEW